MSRAMMGVVTVVVLVVAALLVGRVIPHVVPVSTALMALRQGDGYEGAGTPTAATVPRVGPAFSSGLPYSLALQQAQHAADARWFLVVLTLLLLALALGVYTIRLALRSSGPTGEPGRS